ncbi:MAG: hypothetical protein ACHQDE_08740, partial [Acidimicrobiia bacterium]
GSAGNLRLAMPQSRTRYQRAAMRSKYRRPKRRRGGSLGWNVAIGVVILVGVVAIVLTRGGSGAGDPGNGPPRAANQAANIAGDHWHIALDVNICGEWLGPAPAFEKPYASPNQVGNAGIHSHADGLIHTHPYIPAEEGKNAVVGKFFEYGGWGLSSDSIDLGGSNSAHAQWQGPASDPKKTSWSNGDVCPFGQYKGQKAELRWAVDGKEKTGNPGDQRLLDGETVAIYMLPKSADLPFPTNACDSFNHISDQNTAILSKNSPCRAIDAAATTTAPAASTTLPPSTTLAPTTP